jgi:GTP cyclohydrolase I
MHPMLEKVCKQVMWELGYETMSAHMQDTPKRMAKMLWEMTHPEPFNFTTFPNENNVDEMVVVQDIPFYSLCQHHIVPFFGKAHVAYIPGSRVAGLSKFARCVQTTARGLWVQEHLGTAIADAMCEHLADPVGVAVVLKAEHLCMAMRGVRTPGTVTTTSVMRGAFADHHKQARAEFLSLIGAK